MAGYMDTPNGGPMSEMTIGEELEALFPNAHMEIVDEEGRAVLVTYTGCSVWEFWRNSHLSCRGEDW